MTLTEEFNAKYAEAMQLIKSYIDNGDSEKQTQIDEIKEQLETIRGSEGNGGNLTLLNKLNDIIAFLKTDIVAITRNIFTVNNGGDSDNGNGDNGDINDDEFPTG